MIIVGVTRKLDETGRIALPIELRRVLNWEKSDVLDIVLDEDRQSLTIRKRNPICICCRKDKNLKQLPNGFYLCESCLASIK